MAVICVRPPGLLSRASDRAARAVVLADAPRAVCLRAALAVWGGLQGCPERLLQLCRGMHLRQGHRLRPGQDRQGWPAQSALPDQPHRCCKHVEGAGPVYAMTCLSV